MNPHSISRLIRNIWIKPKGFLSIYWTNYWCPNWLFFSFGHLQKSMLSRRALRHHQHHNHHHCNTPTIIVIIIITIIITSTTIIIPTNTNTNTTVITPTTITSTTIITTPPAGILGWSRATARWSYRRPLMETSFLLLSSFGWEQSYMQVCKQASMQIGKYANMQVC